MTDNKEKWFLMIGDGSIGLGTRDGYKPTWFHRKVVKLLLGFRWKKQ